MPSVREADLQPAGDEPLARIPASTAAGPDAHHVDRSVTDVVIAVAAEVLGGKLPVTRDEPLLDAPQNFGASVAAIPAIERQVEIASELPEILEKSRRLRIPGGPHASFVGRQLSDLHQAELRPVQLPVVGLSEIRHADKLSVGGIAPAVVGTREDRGVSLVVTAHFHPAMPAGVQEHVHALFAIAAQDHRFLSHARHEVVTRLRDLTLVRSEEHTSELQSL